MWEEGHGGQESLSKLGVKLWLLPLPLVRVTRISGDRERNFCF